MKVTESSKSQNEVPRDTSIPEGGDSLESILCTEELQHRPSRPPDYELENGALVKLTSALADSPNTVLQTLAETILHITQCDFAGLSLLTRDGKTPDVCGQKFYWPAIAGIWKPHIGKGTPVNRASNQLLTCAGFAQNGTVESVGATCSTSRKC